MVKLSLKTIGLGIATTPIIFLIGFFMGLTTDQIEIMALFNGLFIYAHYFGPRMDAIIDEHNQKLERESEAAIRRAEAEMDEES